MSKTVPFSLEQIEAISKKYPTPFHIYDEQAIRENARKLKAAFAWEPKYKNYFAVKALPNPSIMQILKEEGMGFDASSLAELELCARINVPGDDIMFTSNNTPLEEFERAIELGARINLDDLSHLQMLITNDVKLPDLLCFRYNPGDTRKISGNDIIGQPAEAKYGMTKEQLFEGYKLAKEKGVKRFGLHTMIVSNERRIPAFAETATMLFEIAQQLKEELDIDLEFINLGGGFGIPYLPEDQPLDIQELSGTLEKLFSDLDLPKIQLCTENGRYITGPYGYLVSRVQHIKDTYKKYVGLDASMSDLMRPGMYGAYHHITVLGKEDADTTYDVTGSLCENNDKFAIDRLLPEVQVGDLVVIHDTGAHGHAMGFQYNGKLRHAELLLQKDGNAKLIRRAETLQDYFETLNF